IVNQRRGSLPELYRPKATDDAKVMNSLRRQLAKQRSALEAVETARQEHERRRETASGLCEKLAERRITELDNPVAAEWGIASALRVSVVQGAAAAHISPPTPLDPAASVSVRAAQVATIEKLAGTVLAAMDEELAAAQADIVAAAE